MATRAWTRQHRRIALLAGLTACSGFLAGSHNGVARYALLGATALAILLGLLSEGLVAAVGGLLLATAWVEVDRRWGVWNSAQLGFVAATVGIILAVAATAGFVGSASRRILGERRLPPPGSVAPAKGSLGLFTPQLAAVRLDEELARAGHRDDGVPILLLALGPSHQGLPDGLTEAASRACGRVLESVLSTVDVPFAFDARRLGVLLPESSTIQAWAIAGRIMDAGHHVTIADRHEHGRRSLQECLSMRAVVITARPSDRGQAVLARAERSLATAAFWNSEPDREQTPDPERRP